MKNKRRVLTRGCCGLALIVSTGLFMTTFGCTGTTKRLDPDSLSEQEVGTGLTSQDFRSVCDRIARSLVQVPQIQNSTTPPKIAIEPVENATNDYIDADEFARKIRTHLIKFCGGKAVFLDRDLTDSIKREQREKRRGQITSSGEKDRYGADFFLTGRLSSLDRVAGKGVTTYYNLSFRLTDAATSAIVWEDDYEIKKASTVGGVYR